MQILRSSYLQWDSSLNDMSEIAKISMGLQEANNKGMYRNYIFTSPLLKSYMRSRRHFKGFSHRRGWLKSTENLNATPLKRYLMSQMKKTSNVPM
jgi:hypothetical protein